MKHFTDKVEDVEHFVPGVFDKDPFVMFIKACTTFECKCGLGSRSKMSLLINIRSKRGHIYGTSNRTYVGIRLVFVLWQCTLQQLIKILLRKRERSLKMC